MNDQSNPGKQNADAGKSSSRSPGASKSGSADHEKANRNHQGGDMPGQGVDPRSPGTPAAPQRGMNDGGNRPDQHSGSQTPGSGGTANVGSGQANRQSRDDDSRVDNASSDMLSDPAPKTGERTRTGERGISDTGLAGRRDGESPLDDDSTRIDPATGPTADSAHRSKTNSGMKPGTDGDRAGRNDNKPM